MCEYVTDENPTTCEDIYNCCGCEDSDECKEEE